MSVVRITNFTRRYGSFTAVDNFSLAAEPGELMALVGPDGAGKTTLFRSICGLLEYNSGEINVAGYDVKTQFDKIKPFLGYMPQNFSLYPDLSVEENLSFYAGLFGLSGEQFKEKKRRLYDFSGLGPFTGRRAGMLSGGMKQKLALCCNLVHDPKVLILDEPTTGVDPVSRRQFWEILKTLKEGGSTIIVSTPYMDEVELADRAVFIFDGRKLAEARPKEFPGMFKGSVYQIGIVPDRDRMARLKTIEGLTFRRFGSSTHLYVPPGRRIEDYRDNLRQLGLPTENITPIEPELEDVFIQLMEQKHA